MTPHNPRPPQPQKQSQRPEAHHAPHHVHERGPDEVGHRELHARKRGAAHEDCRPGADEPPPARHSGHHPGRHDEREEGELSARERGDRLLVETRDLRQRDDRRAERAEGDGGRIGDEGEAGRLERREAGAGHERRRDRDRRPEPGRPLQKRAEAEGDEERLEPVIGRESHHRPLHDVERARLDAQPVEEHRRHDDPADRKQAECRAMHGRGRGGVSRHADDAHGDHQRRSQSGQRRPVGRPAGEREQTEQHGQRHEGHERRKQLRPQRVIYVRPDHGRTGYRPNRINGRSSRHESAGCGWPPAAGWSRHGCLRRR